MKSRVKTVGKYTDFFPIQKGRGGWKYGSMKGRLYPQFGKGRYRTQDGGFVGPAVNGLFRVITKVGGKGLGNVVLKSAKHLATTRFGQHLVNKGKKNAY